LNGPIQPVKTNKMLYDGEIKPNWNTLFKQNNNKILIIKDKKKKKKKNPKK
jgi:hypothetical protein